VAAAAPAAAAPVVVVQAPPAVDGLIYYPSYEMYFDPDTSVYWYNQNGGWVHGPTPYGVSVDVLSRAPSVRTGFHDSPANHHADVSRQYPKNWQPDDHGRH
jgi:hypothetical protein